MISRWVVTFPGNVSVGGSPQAEVILGTGCVGSGGVCNGGAVTVSSNIVTIPLTNVANAQTINVRINGDFRRPAVPATDVVDPMRRLLGDTNASFSITSADIRANKGVDRPDADPGQPELPFDVNPERPDQLDRRFHNQNELALSFVWLRFHLEGAALSPPPM